MVANLTRSKRYFIFWTQRRMRIPGPIFEVTELALALFVVSLTSSAAFGFRGPASYAVRQTRVVSIPWLPRRVIRVLLYLEVFEHLRLCFAYIMVRDG